MFNKKTVVNAVRLDDNRTRIESPSGIEMMLFANEQVPLERSALTDMAAISDILDSVFSLDERRFFGDPGAVSINRAAFTPDYHHTGSIPVGTVLECDGMVFPRAAGSDIGCGMRLVATDITIDEFNAIGPKLDASLRHIHFQGGRDIPLDETGRAGMLREGPRGLRVPSGGGGIWSHMNIGRVMNGIKHTHQGGCWHTDDLWAFEGYVRGSGGVSRDAAIASIGGGNHFCEIQVVEDCLDRQKCYEWGIRKNTIVVMVHTGSLDIGSSVGSHFSDLARKLHPKGMAVPEHGYHPLPLVGPLAHHGRAYLSAMGLAANFAVVNRLFLAELTVQCLAKSIGREVSSRLVYDAPHNVAWSYGTKVIHRKGACPADVDEQFPGGQPVIVPGSMGDSSYLLKGLANEESLCSAPHGTGRISARGQGRKADPGEIRKLRVVTKVDLTKIRRDIAQELEQTLMEEAPSNYKPSLPVIETCANAGLASPVARLSPLLTVKG